MILQNARRRLDNAKAAKGTLGGQGDDRRTKLAEVKKRTNCAVCGKVGHWHTDPECPDCEKTMKEKAAKGKGRGRPRVPAGAKGKGASRAHEANTVSALSSGAPVCTAGVAFLGTGAAGPPSAPLAWSWPQAREPRDHVAVMAVQHFSVVTGDTDSEGSEGYASDSGSSLQARQVLHTIQEGWSDADLVVLDTACARSVAGKEWLTRHDQSLRDRFGFGCTVSAENEVFRFGNGQPQTSIQSSAGGSLRTSWARRSNLGLVPYRVRFRHLCHSVCKHPWRHLDTATDTVSFRRLGIFDLPCVRTRSGHLGVCISEFPSIGLPPFAASVMDDGTGRHLCQVQRYAPWYQSFISTRSIYQTSVCLIDGAPNMAADEAGNCRAGRLSEASVPRGPGHSLDSNAAAAEASNGGPHHEADSCGTESPKGTHADGNLACLAGSGFRTHGRGPHGDPIKDGSHHRARPFQDVRSPSKSVRSPRGAVRHRCDDDLAAPAPFSCFAGPADTPGHSADAASLVCRRRLTGGPCRARGLSLAPAPLAPLHQGDRRPQGGSRQAMGEGRGQHLQGAEGGVHAAPHAGPGGTLHAFGAAPGQDRRNGRRPAYEPGPARKEGVQGEAGEVRPPRASSVRQPAGPAFPDLRAELAGAFGTLPRGQGSRSGRR